MKELLTKKLEEISLKKEQLNFELRVCEENEKLLHELLDFENGVEISHAKELNVEEEAPIETIVEETY